MCIKQSVGEGGNNDKGDVRTVQLLLNMNSGRGEFVCALVTDGLWGPGSRTALKRYQELQGIAQSKTVSANDDIIKALRAGLPSTIGTATLWAVLIDATGAKVEAFRQPILDVFARYKIDTPLRQAHFLAQIAHESGCLLYTEEIASGSAYEGRKDLGNTQSGDGKRFKGRGLIQLTGRANYRHYGQACGRDFELKDAPTLVSTDPFLAVDVAGWFWDSRKLNTYADKDDVKEVTRRINGGFNGLDDRIAYLTRAKWLLGL